MTKRTCMENRLKDFTKFPKFNDNLCNLCTDCGENSLEKRMAILFAFVFPHKLYGPHDQFRVTQCNLYFHRTQAGILTVIDISKYANTW